MHFNQNVKFQHKWKRRIYNILTKLCSINKFIEVRLEIIRYITRNGVDSFKYMLHDTESRIAELIWMSMQSVKLLKQAQSLCLKSLEHVIDQFLYRSKLTISALRFMRIKKEKCSKSVIHVKILSLLLNVTNIVCIVVG